jgi:hypothetical protein
MLFLNPIAWFPVHQRPDLSRNLCPPNRDLYLLRWVIRCQRDRLTLYILYCGIICLSQEPLHTFVPQNITFRERIILGDNR